MSRAPYWMLRAPHWMLVPKAIEWAVCSPVSGGPAAEQHHRAAPAAAGQYRRKRPPVREKDGGGQGAVPDGDHAGVAGRGAHLHGGAGHH
eukprot:1186592-Prorocentrum_minimum.AAC.2